MASGSVAFLTHEPIGPDLLPFFVVPGIVERMDDASVVEKLIQSFALVLDFPHRCEIRGIPANQRRADESLNETAREPISNTILERHAKPSLVSS